MSITSSPEGLSSGGRDLWKSVVEVRDLDAAQQVQPSRGAAPLHGTRPPRPLTPRTAGEGAKTCGGFKVSGCPRWGAVR